MLQFFSVDHVKNRIQLNRYQKKKGYTTIFLKIGKFQMLNVKRPKHTNWSSVFERVCHYQKIDSTGDFIRVKLLDTNTKSP